MKEYFQIIKELREDNDISQKEMGKILGVSQNTISQYESGTRTLPINILRMYAKQFNVSTDYILGLTDKPETQWNVKNQINISGGINVSGNKNKLSF